MCKDKKATREDVERLKRDWAADPCWDIAETEGFEEYEDELRAFQVLKRAEMNKTIVVQQVDWHALWRKEMRARSEEMVRNAGLVEQNSELLHALAQIVAHPGDADAQSLAEDVLARAE